MPICSAKLDGRMGCSLQCVERDGKDSSLPKKQDDLEWEGYLHASHGVEWACMNGREYALTEFRGTRRLLMRAMMAFLLSVLRDSRIAKPCSEARPAKRSAIEFSRKSFL